MALSNGQSFNGTPLIYLSPRGKDSEGEELAQPYFEISRVNAETKKIKKILIHQMNQPIMKDHQIKILKTSQQMKKNPKRN